MLLFSKIAPDLLLAMPGGMEWLWIVIGVLVLFGGKKLPELAKGLGKGMREFKEAKDGVPVSGDKEIIEERKVI